MAGLAFGFRYQTALFYLGSFLFLIAKRRLQLRDLPFLVLGGLLMLLLQFFIDAWGYGEWTFAPYNYFHSNLIKGVAASFGTSPWYSYPALIYKDGNYGLLGLILFVFTLLFAIFNIKRCLISSGVLMFFAIHSYIGHKDPRFMIPVMLLMPIVFHGSLETLKIWGGKIISSKCRYLLYLFLLVNFLLLAEKSFTDTFGGSKIISVINQQKVDRIYFSAKHDPLTGHGLRLYFFNSHAKTKRVNYFEEIKDKKRPFIYYKELRNQEISQPHPIINCKILYQNRYFTDFIKQNFSKEIAALLLQGATVKKVYLCK